MSTVSGRLGCSSGGHLQGDACLFDEEGVAVGDLLEIVGEAADHLVVVLGQAGEEGQLVGEGAGGGAGGHGAARLGGRVGGTGMPEVSGANRGRPARTSITSSRVMMTSRTSSLDRVRLGLETVEGCRLRGGVGGHGTATHAGRPGGKATP